MKKHSWLLISAAAILLVSLPGKLLADNVTLDYRYVVINLSTEDSNSSNRNYKGVDTSLSALIRCNSRLSTYGGNGAATTYTQAPAAPPASTATPAPTATPPGATPTPTPSPTATPKKKPKSAKDTAKDGNKEDNGD